MLSYNESLGDIEETIKPSIGSVHYLSLMFVIRSPTKAQINGVYSKTLKHNSITKHVMYRYMKID
jgi:hypothetical protein